MSVELKARRLLTEGRVKVLDVGPTRPGHARVEGDHGTYEVEIAAGQVVCACPAWKRRCSHALAVELVVVVYA